LESQLETKNTPMQTEIDAVLALLSSGQIKKTLYTCDFLITKYPNEVWFYNISGICYANLGQLETAVKKYEQALTIKPDYAMVHNNLGITLLELDQLNAGVKCFEQALAIKPDYAEAHCNLGITLKSLGQLEAAVKCYEQALAIKPDYAEAYYNIAIAFQALGQLEAAVKGFEQALAIKPDYAKAQSNRLFTFNYSPNCEPDFCLKEARKFGALCRKKAAARFSDFQCSPAPKQLKIGLVSGDLRKHPVGYFLESVLSALTDQNLELIAYTTHPKFDDLSARIKPFFSGWKALFGLTDEGAAKLIHDDGIHILIDLSGHTAHNRLPVFAFKPAPVQVSWLGYGATTGLKEIDYIIADDNVLPPQIEDQFSEQIWRLPSTYLCFTPPNTAIKINKLPALHHNHITFGSFNNLAKINDSVIVLWGKVLFSIPNSRLILKTKQLKNLSVCENILQKFSTYGIERNRIILKEPIPEREKHLATYNEIDIALDPFPYCGVTTSFEALWMGVPVLTLQGNTLVSNQGVGILMNAGLAHWIAHDEDDYLAKAINFSSNLKQLASIRSGLREQVLASPLFDAKQFSVDYKNALWSMWQQWLTDNNSI